MCRIVKVSDIKAGLEDENHYRLYIIETEGGITLYVGKSECAITRIEGYMSLGAWGTLNNNTHMGRLLPLKESQKYNVHLLGDGFVAKELGLAVQTNPVVSNFQDYQANKAKHDLAVERYMEYHRKIEEGLRDLELKLIYELSPVFNMRGKKKHKRNIDMWAKITHDPPPKP